MKKYFSNIQPLSVSERNYKIKNRDILILEKKKEKKKLEIQYKWKNNWSGNSKLFSDLPYLKSNKPNIFKRKKPRKQTYRERLYNSIYKMIECFDRDPIRTKWIKIKDNILNKKKTGMNSIFDNVVSNFHYINNKDDLLWIGAKYSPEIIS